VNHLVLIRVAADLDRVLRRAVLRDFLQEAPQRYRLSFDTDAGPRTFVVSVRPEMPWIGRPAARGRRQRFPQGPLAAAAARVLRGTPLAAVEKPASDRWLRLDFGEAGSVVVTLGTHRANVLLLDGTGALVAWARRPPSQRAGLQPGRTWVAPVLPRRLLDPDGRDPLEIDAHLDREVARGESRFVALRRSVFGVGSEGAELVLDEAAAEGRSAGQVLALRLAALVAGKLDPQIVGSRDPRDPEDSAEGGRWKLYPWPPREVGSGLRRYPQADPATSAGLYHEARERAADAGARRAALAAILDRESERAAEALRRVALDLSRFDDPERHRRWGEALLAGLRGARRDGDTIRVPDPYGAPGTELSVPARPGEAPSAAAERHFREHRRARRGLLQAEQRRERLEARVEALSGLCALAPAEALPRLEAGMRGMGIPVALEPATRSAQRAGAARSPRLEGVRMFWSRDGIAILVGRGGADNHRLTFKLAAPHDFWLHALGVTGAHVIVRNDERRPAPPQTTLHEAAALAAWFSDARSEERVDVQWTQRKNVRRPRGAVAGTVLVKRFGTVRVRPAPPVEERNDR